MFRAPLGYSVARMPGPLRWEATYDSPQRRYYIARTPWEAVEGLMEIVGRLDCE